MYHIAVFWLINLINDKKNPHTYIWNKSAFIVQLYRKVHIILKHIEVKNYSKWHQRKFSLDNFWLKNSENCFWTMKKKIS